MTRFWRDGHYRTSMNGVQYWVDGHWVDRGIWDKHEADFTYSTDSRAYPTACPVCQAPVFFYQNAAGSRVFFNHLGPPWPKHPCTSSDRAPNPRSPGIAAEPPSEGWRQMTVLELLYRGAIQKTIITMAIAGHSEPAILFYAKWRSDLPSKGSLCFQKGNQISFFSMKELEPVSLTGHFEYAGKKARRTVRQAFSKGTEKAGKPPEQAKAAKVSNTVRGKTKVSPLSDAEREAERVARERYRKAPKEVAVEHRRGGVLVRKRIVTRS